jgi:hypothetical protein
MRKILLYLHMYGGLIAAVYLILLGISSLQFQHHFFPDAGPPTTWERDVPVHESTTLTPEYVVDQLGLMGKVNRNSYREDKDGTARIDLYRPGRSYAISYTSQGHVKVSERRNTWNIVTALHGLTSVPNSRFMTAWGVYTHFATIFGILAAISGIYLFASVKRDRIAGLITLGICGVLAGAWMIFLVYHG